MRYDQERNCEGGISLLSTFITLLIAACNQPAESLTPVSMQKKVDTGNVSQQNQSIGWIHGRCLAIRKATLKPGDIVQVVLLTHPQQHVVSKVKGIATKKSECPALHEGRAAINGQEGRIFYILDFKTEDISSTGIGLVRNMPIHKSDQGVIEFDLDNDGVREHAGACTTSEGAIFYVSTAKIFDKNAMWSDYYYLGYDVERTCPIP